MTSIKDFIESIKDFIERKQIKKVKRRIATRRKKVFESKAYGKNFSTVAFRRAPKNELEARYFTKRDLGKQQPPQNNGIQVFHEPPPYQVLRIHQKTKDRIQKHGKVCLVLYSYIFRSPLELRFLRFLWQQCWKRDELAMKILLHIPSLQEKCSITMDKLSYENAIWISKCKDPSGRRYKGCEHMFSKDALYKWLLEHDSSCPLCRSQVAEVRTIQECKQIKPIHQHNNNDEPNHFRRESFFEALYNLENYAPRQTPYTITRSNRDRYYASHGRMTRPTARAFNLQEERLDRLLERSDQAERADEETPEGAIEETPEVQEAFLRSLQQARRISALEREQQERREIQEQIEQQGRRDRQRSSMTRERLERGFQRREQVRRERRELLQQIERMGQVNLEEREFPEGILSIIQNLRGNFRFTAGHGKVHNFRWEELPQYESIEPISEDILNRAKRLYRSGEDIIFSRTVGIVTLSLLVDPETLLMQIPRSQRTIPLYFRKINNNNNNDVLYLPTNDIPPGLESVSDDDDDNEDDYDDMPELAYPFSNEDVKVVMEQMNVLWHVAFDTLSETNGNIVEACIKLQK